MLYMPLLDLDSPDPTRRATAATALGLASSRWARGTTAALRRLVDGDPDARVRRAAVGALVRRGSAATAAQAWQQAAGDVDASVRRRAAELAPTAAGPVPTGAVLQLLADDEPLVAEAAAFALGERPAEAEVVQALAAAVTDHGDPLVREAAVAALGSLGDELGLPAILRACRDKPAIRRRAVLALASFEGAEVDAELQRALEDKDWQVRQAAEDLLEP